MGPNVKGNPLYMSVYLLIFSYIIGEFLLPKYSLFFLINLLGFMGIISSAIIFFSAVNLFKAYKEKLLPQTDTDKIIKTGIYAYSRNPIYVAFVLFHLSMFLTFENVAYFLCSLGLFFWINHSIIPAEEKYLNEKFNDEFERYCIAVKRWIFF
tara:strand:+ start:1902 stop:2360 length:459 start_codon:yes stop_codon:yes gene_type:complete